MQQGIRGRLKAGIRKILPNRVVRYLQQYRQLQADARWIDQVVVPCLPDEWEHRALYERQSRELIAKYRRVELCQLFSARFGDMIITFYLQHEFPAKEGEMVLFIPVGYIYDMEPIYQFLHTEKYIANPVLFYKITEQMPVLTRKNAGFWRYFITYHRDRIYPSRRFDSFSMQAMNREFIRRKAYRHTYLTFTPEEERKGQQELKQMGITGKYVCFFSRTNEYLKKFLHADVDTDLASLARNSHIEKFSLMCERLHKKGIQSIRMGKFVDAPFTAQGCIDYASQYYSPFMDLYLSAHAQCFVADFSAMQLFAALFQKPLVLTNVSVFTMHGDSITYCEWERDILLPKKLYDTIHQRYLTFREILEVEKREDLHLKVYAYYESHGIVYEENTPEEIADATDELLERIAGKIEYTQEDISRQECIRALLNWATEGRDCFVHDVPIARDFLRNNPWFLA